MLNEETGKFLQQNLVGHIFLLGREKMNLWISFCKLFAIIMLALMAGLPLCAAEEQTSSGSSAGPLISKGWMIKGDQPDKFDFGIDRQMIREGKPCAFIKSRVEKVDGLGTLRQAISAKKFLGKRIRFSGWLRTENVKDSAGLWVRVDGSDHKMLEFDNMEKRPVKGTTDWTKYSCVVDVPDDAKAILFGFLLFDAGKVWANQLNLEAVGKDVASTNIAPAPDRLPEDPINIDFSEI